MEHHPGLIQACLLSIVIVAVSACSQTVNTATSQGGIAIPFSISDIPKPSELKATLTCPDGTIIPMSLDTVKNTASGECKNISPGSNKTFTVNFTYGSNNLELARGERKIDVSSGSSQSITFLNSDYDESFDDDHDGFTNLVEIIKGLNPNKPDSTSGGIVTVSSDSLILSSPDNNLTATVDCPGGTSVVMTIDTTANHAIGGCSGIPPAANQTFTVHFFYSSANIEIARGTKAIDVIDGTNPNLIFSNTDFDSSFDDDNDGFTNLYEITNHMDPESPNYIITTVSPLPLGGGSPNSAMVSATLDCPDGTTAPLVINLPSNTATGNCIGLMSSLSSGSNQPITVHFYEITTSTNIELARASKAIAVTTGNSVITFSNVDYDTSFDDDNDGFTNLYEITNNMDPTKANYPVGGSISGLNGSLALNFGSETLTLTNNGMFSFATAPVDGSAYDISVSTQPSGQTCTVNYGKGTINGASVNNIYVGCAKNGLVYLNANDGTAGNELYISDGTAAGTTLLKNINPYTNSNPQNIITANGITYFTANDGVHGIELWKSDTSGTVMIKDINPGPGSSSPRNLTPVINGTTTTVYFAADDGTHGLELWQTDGTNAGTTLVMDIAPGAAGSFTSDLTAVGSTLYFNASDGANLGTLWHHYIDSTTGNYVTAMVDPSSTRTTLGNFVPVGSLLYFRAYDNVNGYSIWRSDGTPTGTIRIAAFASTDYMSTSPNNRIPPVFAAIGSTLYFASDDGTSGVELWKYDGTTASLVKDIYPGKDSNSTPYSSYPTNLTAISNTLFFVANDGIHGTELWKSDGTSSGTQMVKDIHANAAGSNPSELTVNGSTLYFSANDGINGVELWKSDGSDTGTQMVSDINPGAGDSYPNYLTSVNNMVYFSANNGSDGQELWRSYFDSNSITDVTEEVMDINPGPKDSNPQWLANNAGVLYFAAFDDTHGMELWLSDSSNTTGTATRLVKDISQTDSDSNPSHFYTINSIHYFKADDGTGLGENLWRTDGTAQGTYLVKRINPRGNSQVFELGANANTLFFSASNGIDGWELWKSDGTTTGTVMVKDIFPGPYNSYPYGLIAFNNDVYFNAYNDRSGWELWKSDGTYAGTLMVKDIVPGYASSSPFPYTVFNNKFYFTADDGVNGSQIWSTTGDNTGTSMVTNIQNLFPGQLTPFGSSLYFSGSDPTAGTELWKTDGVTTTLISDINPSGPSLPNNLTPVGNTLYFTADDGTNGRELWQDAVSNATDTVKMTADINPTGSSSPNNLTPVANQLYFLADDGSHGVEPWKSDPATGQTTMIADINTTSDGVGGTLSSNPRDLTAVQNTLYFMADDGTHGYELWKSDSNGTAMVTDLNSTGDGIIEVLGH